MELNLAADSDNSQNDENVKLVESPKNKNQQ